MSVKEKDDVGLGFVPLVELVKSLCEMTAKLVRLDNNAENSDPHLLMPRIGQGLTIWCAGEHGKGPKTQNFEHLFRDQLASKNNPEVPVYSA